MSCPLFVELCGGLASLSLRLQGGPHCRPPVSRMGNKAGYAGAILEVLGLRSGQGADSFLWCEPDDGCRALLQAYPQPDVLREAADIIRSWADEDPRALWERLRAEGPIRGAGGGEVARYTMIGTWSKTGKAWGATRDFVKSEGADFTDRHGKLGHWQAQTPARVAPRLDRLAASEIARWARIVTGNRLTPDHHDGQSWTNPGKGGSTFGGPDLCTDAAALARGFDGVSAREVGRWEYLSHAAYRRGFPESGYNPVSDGHPGWSNFGAKSPANQELARNMDRPHPSSWPPVTVCADAREVDPGQLPEGTVAYLDGPYEGTTGYGNLLPRSEQVALALRWAEAGATVCVSEAEPLPELTALGWHHVEITGTRKGQKRTFSKQQREFLTLNREPCWRPSVTLDLFGAA